MTEHRYIERTDRGFCDFCTIGIPAITWKLPPGRSMDMHVVNPETAEIIHSSHDEDGLWTACTVCDEAIRTYKKSKIKPSALRKFVRELLKRNKRVVEKYAHIPGVEHAVRKHQMTLFGQLLPMLRDPETFKPNGQLRITARGDEELVEMTREMREGMHKDWEERHGPSSEPEISTFEEKPPSDGAIVPPFEIPDGPTRGGRF